MPSSDVYCDDTNCGHAIVAQGWEVVQEFGDIRRFPEPAQTATRATDAEAAGWSFVPSNHVLAQPHQCASASPGDCSVLRRFSPNGMLNASHPLHDDATSATMPYEWTAAWGDWEGANDMNGGSSSDVASSRCQLVVSDAAGSRTVEAVQRSAHGAMQMSTGSFSPPAWLSVVAPRGGGCVVAYILRRPLDLDSSSPPPTVQVPVMAPTNVGMTAGDAAALHAALVATEQYAEGSNVTIELSASTYDLSGSEWPFDFGRTSARVEIRPAASASSNVTLDAKGARPMLHLSLATNHLSLRDLTLRNGSAVAAPAHGAAVLLSAGKLHAESCAFEDFFAAGHGGALALLSGASAELDSCRLASNRARRGGALAAGSLDGVAAQCDGDASATLPLVIRSSTLVSNAADERGGAVWQSCGQLDLSTSTVSHNSAGLSSSAQSSAAVGGAVDAEGAAGFILRDSAFATNYAGGHGAAVNYDPSVLSSDPPDVDNCTFTNNSGLSTFRALQNVDFTCRRGQWTPSTGAFDELAATTATGHYEGCFFVCARGYYGKSTKETKATCTGSCPRGHYCDEGTVTPEPCPLGTHAPTEGASSRTACIQCAPGSFGASTGNGNATCTPCPAGSFTENLGQSSCSPCPPGGYCPSAGAASRTTWVPCPSGRYSPDPGLSAESQCVACPDGTYNPSSGGTDEGACVPCVRGSWCAGGQMEFCSAGTYADETGRSSCSSCVKGHWCGDGTTTPVPCEGGRYANATGLTGADECTPVESGYWAPTGSMLPEPCPASGFRCPGRAADDVNTPPGSKPIIIEVGAHTEEVIVTRTLGRVSYNLTLEASLDDYDELATVASLAVLYNVSAADVSVRVLSGSILLSIEIAQPSPEAAQQLREAVLAVPDVSLSAALNVSTSRVGDVATATLVVLEETQVAIDCPRGHWCSAGKKIECVRNTYNPDLNMDDASACRPCPSYSHTEHAAATSPYACACDVGFVKAAGAANATQASASRGETMTCVACPEGANCSAAGVTIEALPVLRGYYRTSSTSSDLRRCPDFGDRSGCVGGVGGGEGPCKPWLTGPYCRLCNVTDTTRYYAASESSCLACKGNAELPIIVGVGVVLLAIFIGLLWTRFSKVSCAPCLARLGSRSARIFMQLSLRPKLKQLLGFYQVATRIADVYEVPMPRAVAALLSVFELVNLNIKGIGLPLQCLGLGSYEQQLATTMLLPVVLAIVGLLGSVVRSCCKGGSSRLSNGFLAALPWLLPLSFLVFPMVSSAAFRAFSCEAFDDGRLYLRADYAVECGTDTHARAKSLAWLGIALYPCGISALYIALMLCARRAILDEKSTSLSVALGFLTQDFEPAYFWWELLEAWKKLFLVGFLQLAAQPGSLEQLTLGFLLSIIYLLLVSVAQPFKDDGDDAFGKACAFALTCLFYFSGVLKVGVLTEDVESTLSPRLSQLYSFDGTFVTVSMIVSVLSALLLAALMTVIQLIVAARVPIIKLEATHASPELPLRPSHRWHLFLSHVWSTGQDQCATIKRQLTLLLPSASIFLDVDDLQDTGELENYVEQTAVIMIFVSKGYFKSRNCLREAVAAVEKAKPITLVHDPTKGGASREAIERDECPNELRPKVFVGGREVIEWHRVKDFQLVSLKQLAEQLLLGCPTPNGLPPPRRVELYVPGEIARQSMAFATRVLLYSSPDNPGAAAIADAIRAGMKNTFATTSDPRMVGSSGSRSSARFAANAPGNGGATHFLLYLNSQTFVGEAGERLAAELRTVRLSGGASVVLVHETDVGRGGCEFGRFFETTPGDLIQDGLYKSIAVDLMSGLFWPVSVALVARALGAVDARHGLKERFHTSTAVPPEPEFGAGGGDLPANAWLAAAVRPSKPPREGGSSDNNSGLSMAQKYGSFNGKKSARMTHRASIADAERQLPKAPRSSLKDGPGRLTCRERPSRPPKSSAPPAARLPSPASLARVAGRGRLLARLGAHLTASRPQQTHDAHSSAASDARAATGPDPPAVLDEWPPARDMETTWHV